jgi:hypothetical protein
MPVAAAVPQPLDEPPDGDRVPRVAGGRPGQLQGRPAIGELVQRQLAEQHGAGRAQAAPRASAVARWFMRSLE